MIVFRQMILNAIDIVHHSQFVNKNACKYLKPWLYRTCSRLPDCAETRKLISHLLRTMAMVQLCSGNLKQSIDFSEWSMSFLKCHCFLKFQ